MGLEEPFPETAFKEDKIFQDLAQASKTDIYDLETLKIAIERIHPERINNVKQALRKEISQSRNAAFGLGIKYALEFLEYGGEENYIEEEKES